MVVVMPIVGWIRQASVQISVTVAGRHCYFQPYLFVIKPITEPMPVPEPMLKLTLMLTLVLMLMLMLVPTLTFGLVLEPVQS